jgi:hypothetical protein
VLLLSYHQKTVPLSEKPHTFKTPQRNNGLLAFIFQRRKREEYSHNGAARQQQQRWAKDSAVRFLQHEIFRHPEFKGARVDSSSRCNAKVPLQKLR